MPFSSHQLLIIAPGKPRFDWHKNWNIHHCIDHWSFQQGECKSMLQLSKLHGVFKGLCPKQQHRIANSMAFTSVKWSVFLFHLYCNHPETGRETCPDTTVAGRHHPFWWCSNDNYTFLWLSRICVCRRRMIKRAKHKVQQPWKRYHWWRNYNSHLIKVCFFAWDWTFPSLRHFWKRKNENIDI